MMLQHKTSDEIRREFAERRARAFKGKAGVDYFPNEKCAECGGMMWWDGKRYHQDHDFSKHGGIDQDGRPIPVTTRKEAREGDRPERVNAALDRMQAVRRSTGTLDNDD